ncbi:hypothetical protein ACC691_40780, partial [Rhizobium johnstonii]
AGREDLEEFGTEGTQEVPHRASPPSWGSSGSLDGGSGSVSTSGTDSGVGTGGASGGAVGDGCGGPAWMGTASVNVVDWST